MRGSKGQKIKDGEEPIVDLASKKWCVKLSKESIGSVLEIDVQMNEVVEYGEMVLVGQVLAFRESERSLKDWVDKEWGGFLGYNHVSLIIPRG